MRRGLFVLAVIATLAAPAGARAEGTTYTAPYPFAWGGFEDFECPKSLAGSCGATSEVEVSGVLSIDGWTSTPRRGTLPGTVRLGTGGAVGAPHELDRPARSVPVTVVLDIDRLYSQIGSGANGRFPAGVRVSTTLSVRLQSYFGSGLEGGSGASTLPLGVEDERFEVTVWVTPWKGDLIEAAEYVVSVGIDLDLGGAGVGTTRGVADVAIERFVVGPAWDGGPKPQ